MPPIDSDYRPDPARSVEIYGVFDDNLAHNALSRILFLRNGGSTPITLLINSDGGSVNVLDLIDGALKCADLDGKNHRVITVAIGNASSAAANLLAFGDYSIAYPNSWIHFHGVRLSEIQVTAEDAAGVTKLLAQANLKISRKLSTRIFKRLIHRFVVCRNTHKAKGRKSKWVGIWTVLLLPLDQKSMLPQKIS
jgi:ATP-dependent protease ClpP protease subunit